ncbi:MAG: hypothetical protein QOK23_384 [Gammaproteobacteria bacterium]|jgi:hypothetical protein|nr:hypothetical protein [Gammaproteobacteria bacterium]
MTDVYVYCFTGWDGSKDVSTRSQRRATLETIKGLGEPIMESQIVVDDAELDTNGFFHGDVANDAHPTEGVRSEIKSLNLRAASRDSQALNLSEAASGADKYMLQLESRELRKQAQQLQKQYESGTDKSGFDEFLRFGHSPSAG